MGIQSFNPSPEKPINIDFPEGVEKNEFDTSKTARRIADLEAKIKKTEEEISAYENRPAVTNEREEERREILDNVLDKKKILLLQYKKQLETAKANKIEVDFKRDDAASLIFRNKDNTPEIYE